MDLTEKPEQQPPKPKREPSEKQLANRQRLKYASKKASEDYAQLSEDKKQKLVFQKLVSRYMKEWDFKQKQVHK
jgi:two-component SAPR family response regulator